MANPALSGLAQLVENRIAEAIARGEFDNLPGAGKPLALDDDLLVPEGERMALRIMKNAGCVPPGVERLAEVERLLTIVGDDEGTTPEQHAAAARRLFALVMQIEADGRKATATRAWHDYEAAVARRLKS
jgi:hypothetical protein